MLVAESDPLQTRAVFEDEIDAERRERCLALEVTLDLKSESCKLEFQLFSTFFKLSCPDRQCESARSKKALANGSDAWR